MKFTGKVALVTGGGRGIGAEIARNLARDGATVAVSARTGIPVLFDAFHHQIHNRGESAAEALRLAALTWKEVDGLPMVDYSQPAPGRAMGSHAASIDIGRFRRFLSETNRVDFDVMLEIKDKEKSALRAARAARHDPRFIAAASA